MEIVKTGVAVVAGIVAALLVALALGWLLNLVGLANFAFFAPKVEAARYQVFKESQSYNEGMVRHLGDIKRQYLSASPDQRQALRALVVHEFGVYPFDRLPPDLQQFYLSVQGVQQ